MQKLCTQIATGPEIDYYLKFHNFYPVIMKLGQYDPQFTSTGRRFFGTEVHSPYDVHFLKSDGIWNAIVRLKR